MGNNINDMISSIRKLVKLHMDLIYKHKIITYQFIWGVTAVSMFHAGVLIDIILLFLLLSLLSQPVFVSNL
jgi:hypothetical protein